MELTVGSTGMTIFHTKKLDFYSVYVMIAE